jgi:hypothetical protein
MDLGDFFYVYVVRNSDMKILNTVSIGQMSVMDNSRYLYRYFPIANDSPFKAHYEEKSRVDNTESFAILDENIIRETELEEDDHNTTKSLLKWIVGENHNEEIHFVLNISHNY